MERALPLFHDRLGLVGKADAVEFEAGGNPYPVEYKRGSRHKRADIAACDEVQLAAQALCDREQISIGVASGIAGLAISEMIDELGRRRIPVVRYSTEDLERELKYFRGPSGRR